MTSRNKNKNFCASLSLHFFIFFVIKITKMPIIYNFFELHTSQHLEWKAILPLTSPFEAKLACVACVDTLNHLQNTNSLDDTWAGCNASYQKRIAVLETQNTLLLHSLQILITKTMFVHSDVSYMFTKFIWSIRVTGQNWIQVKNFKHARLILNFFASNSSPI